MSEPILFRSGEKAQFTKTAWSPLAETGCCGFNYGDVITITEIVNHKSPQTWLGPWYAFAEGDNLVVCHQALRRIDPIHDAAGSWKDCIWKPSSTKKQISHEPVQA